MIFMSIFGKIGDFLGDLFDGKTAEDEKDEELYYYYKKLYEEAVEDEIRYKRRIEDYKIQRKEAKAQRDQLKSNKKYYEKRVEDLEDIVKRLETDGGLFKTFVPDAIDGAKSSIKDVESTYSSAIKVTSAGSVRSPIDAFAVKSVDDESNSRKAHEEYRRVLSNVRGALSNTRSKINSLENDIDRIDDLIDDYEDRKRNAASKKVEYYCEMEYYKCRSRF